MSTGYSIKKGQQHFMMLAGVFMAMAVANMAYEIMYGLSWFVLIFQSVLSLALLGMSLAISKGWKLKNLLFGVLILIGVFSFYQAGTRMPDLRKQDIGFIPVLTLCIGMGYILLGIYLSYSPEITVYTRDQIKKRADNKSSL